MTAMATLARTVPLRGDEDALFRRYDRQLFHCIRASVRGPDELVQDACAFAWLQLLVHQPDRTTIFAWLKTVAIHEAWQLARRERREASVDAEAAGAGEASAALEARDALGSLAHLPERQRRYLSLFIAGYSYDEIARLTGVTYTNVNKHLARARATLRRHSNSSS